MKIIIVFERAVRVVLILAVLACNFLNIPSQVVSAKPLIVPYDCATQQTEIPPAECEALVILYNSTDGDNWFDHTGWLQTDTPCSWFGVICANVTNVTSISMFENNLSGPIPSELANLTQLTTLELVKNLSWTNGTIPPELGSLTNLTTLYLGGYGLSGPIPLELGNLTQLTILDLGGNALSGSIPPQLANLAQLKTLSLENIYVKWTYSPRTGQPHPTRKAIFGY